ncbi:MAG: hypothetical protein ACFCBV_09885 [Phycisphaerales bacterium]
MTRIPIHAFVPRVLAMAAAIRRDAGAQGLVKVVPGMHTLG